VDEIVVVSYDPAWPDRFRLEAELLQHLLPAHVCLRIEHFGSTAVPGLEAKPIIDILLGVGSIAAAVSDAVPLLESVGYSFWRDNPDKLRLFLVKGLPPSSPQRTHHLHVVELGSELWDRLLFRDYLRAHPEEAGRYAAVKRDLAVRNTVDREAYTAGKGTYISGVMEKAMKERP
jgi:GrpB-like predicted nucleotidyltransferase (UPF0157 family)